MAPKRITIETFEDTQLAGVRLALVMHSFVVLFHSDEAGCSEATARTGVLGMCCSQVLPQQRRPLSFEIAQAAAEVGCHTVHRQQMFNGDFGTGSLNEHKLHSSISLS